MRTALLVLLFGMGVSARPAEAVTRARYLMGTICQIEAGDANEIEAAFEEASRIEQRISTWIDGSELSRLNRGEITVVSRELCTLLQQAMEIANDTGGAFNPLVRPLVDLWRTRESGRVPSDAERLKVMPRLALSNATFGKDDFRSCGPGCRVPGPGGRKIDRDPGPGTRYLRLDFRSQTEQSPSALPIVHLANGAQFEEGGFGKGYALDRMLTRITAPHAVLNFGGQLLVRGSERVTIAHPLHRDQPLIALTLTNASLSTSSGSEKSFDIGGVRFSHILDPSTGMALPPRGSVSVIHASAFVADALSTALYVMGPERGLAWARAHGVAAIFISDSGEMTTSSPIDGLAMMKENR
jgi:thiamine biosynthesis lipoprotein